MPIVPLASDHPDYPVLRPLVEAIITAAGGYDRLAREIPQTIRQAVDEVIDTPRTNRFTLSETEKTEKTYLGTKIEILLRARLGLSKGNKLDVIIGGVETDIKNTIGQNWTIPMEAVGHPCLLIKENERTAKCSVGIVIARDNYLNPGKNRDRKRSFAATALQNVWWILKDHAYPQNFWEAMPLQLRQTIMAAKGGTSRLVALFEAVQQKPISRSIVQAVAQQDDNMRRVRRNGGARDILAQKGVAILSGKADRALIAELNLGTIGPDEYISYKPINSEEHALLKTKGRID